MSGSLKFIGGPASLALVKLLEGGGADPTFGERGHAVLRFSAESLSSVRHFVDQQNRVILSCTMIVQEQAVSEFFAVAARFNEDGSLDEGFADGGEFHYEAPVGLPEFLLTVGLPDGKLLLVCRSELLRLNEDGSPDATFGTNGVAPIGNNVTGLEKAILLADGRILVSSRFSGMFVINTEGTADPGFVNPRSQLLLTEHVVCQQTDGKIVLAERITTGPNPRMRLARFSLTGALDTGFATNGFFEPGMRFYPRQLVPTDSGGVAGVTSESSWVYQLTPAGALDADFGLVNSGGVRTAVDDFTGFQEGWGKVFVSTPNFGWAVISKDVPSRPDDFHFAKLHSDGAPDPSANEFFRFSFAKPLFSFSSIAREPGAAGEYLAPVSGGMLTFRGKPGRTRRIPFYAAECGAGENDYLLQFDAKKGQVVATLAHGANGDPSLHPFTLGRYNSRTDGRIFDLRAYRTGRFYLKLRPLRSGKGTSTAQLRLSSIDEPVIRSLRVRIVNPSAR